MKNLFILLLLSFPIWAMAQQNTPPTADARLYDVFEANHIERLQEKNPYLINYYNYFLDHAYQIVDFPAGKNDQFPTVEIEDLENFNIIAIQKEQHLKRGGNHPTYYKIANANKLLIFYAETYFTKKLNQHLGRTYK